MAVCWGLGTDGRRKLGAPGTAGAVSAGGREVTGGDGGRTTGGAGDAGVALGVSVAVVLCCTWTGGAIGDPPPTGGRRGGRTKVTTGVCCTGVSVAATGASVVAPGPLASAACDGEFEGPRPCNGGEMRGGFGPVCVTGAGPWLDSPLGRTSEPWGSGAPYTGTVVTGSNPKCFRIVLARSSSSELEWVFLSVTPNSGSASISFPGLISSSRANSLIRIFIEQRPRRLFTSPDAPLEKRGITSFHLSYQIRRPEQ